MLSAARHKYGQSSLGGPGGCCLSFVFAEVKKKKKDGVGKNVLSY